MAWSRRSFLLAAGAAASLPVRANGRAEELLADVVGHTLKPRPAGGLDIHHIATGRGDSTLISGPDGSSLMIDAGASYTASPPALALRPSTDRRPGEWIGRYARRRLNEVGSSELDVFLVTHQHPDHLGDVGPETPQAPGGAYRLTGVTDVDAIVPIRRLIDRGYPDYAAPVHSTAPFQANYEAFVRARHAAGRADERFRAGALNQLRRDGAAAFADFSIRNLAVNGEVWTGQGETARATFPSIAGLVAQDVPEENVWSAAFRLSYGDFDYFAAGDLTSSTFDGALPWRDVETAAARASGPVEVAVTPHHGMFDATGADMARALAPRTWIVPAWHAVHPSLSTLDRLFNPRLYPGPRDVFATGLDPATAAASPWLMDRLASRAGHVVVRVAPGGQSYRVVVTDNADEGDRVTAIFGPFVSAHSSWDAARPRQPQPAAASH
ncbi:ComEC/Rec2 family competence protein (plasmid) [Brevundimonas staleyi]|uniref:ComEC/Rec2 family competence protein n=1 Tax=Brevundimonas staleyi TaxID=74326 RepID=A0ABW0FNY1_9CAUL